MPPADDRTDAGVAATGQPKPNVLLTGFGPFPGVAHNATGLLVPRLADAAARRFPDVTIKHAILPTEWEFAPLRLDELLEETRPALSMHFGVSRDARGFAVETVARNMAAAIADAAGCIPADVCLLADGPDCRTVGPEAQDLVEALRAEGLPAYLSNDAGTYLCNRVLYHALGNRLCREGLRAYFVHVPSDLAGFGDDGAHPSAGCPLNWDTAMTGGLILLGGALDALSKGSPAGEGTARLRGHADAARGCRTPSGR